MCIRHCRILLLNTASDCLKLGAGPRNCVGKNLAMMELNKIVVELYRHYNVILANPEMPWKISGHWITRQSDMDMILTRRT